MSTRAEQHQAQVLRQERLSAHLVRLVLGGPGLDGFSSTGVPDEWVGLIVPGQFQSRYYTVRSWEERELVLDVVVHDVGLVTEWARRDCVGETVTITDPKASFDPPPGARWWVLAGDLTALPAMARICETRPEVPVHVLAEVSDDLPDYLPPGPSVSWWQPPSPGESALATLVEEYGWPEGEGYFWMAGESAQMRAIRKHLMRVLRRASDQYDVMGYWRATAGRQPRAVDPDPIYRAGKAAGKSDAEIWADYDAAREHEERGGHDEETR